MGLSEDEFADLPYHLRRAALRGGAEGLLEAGFRSRRPAADQQPGSDGSSSAVQQQQQQWGAEQEGARAPSVHGASWRRQYIFVAATMPAEGERSVGAELAARFPDATWLAGRQLHQSKRALQHSWRQVDDEQHRAHVLHVSLAGGPVAVQKAAPLACVPRDAGCAWDLGATWLTATLQLALVSTAFGQPSLLHCLVISLREVVVAEALAS